MHGLPVSDIPKIRHKKIRHKDEQIDISSTIWSSFFYVLKRKHVLTE